MRETAAPPPKQQRETLRDLMTRWKQAALPSSQGGDEGAQASILFGETCRGPLAAHPSVVSVLGHAPPSSSADPQLRVSLLQTLRDRRAATERVPTGQCEDIEDVEDDSGPPLPPPLPPPPRVDYPSGVRKRCLAEDAMDKWFDVTSGTAAAAARGPPRQVATVRRNIVDALLPEVPPLAETAAKPSNMLHHADRPAASGLRPRPQYPPPRGGAQDPFDRLDAALASAFSAHTTEGNDGKPRLDAILDAVCPFDEQALLVPDGGRHSGGGRPSTHRNNNPTALAVLGRLNQAYDAWRHRSATHHGGPEQHEEAALMGTIRKLDAACGIVALHCELAPCSVDALRPSMASLGGPVSHVVVVLDQSVYRDLHIMVGAHIVVGAPYHVLPPAAGSCGLPVVVATFCIRPVSDAVQERTTETLHGGNGPRSFVYDPLVQGAMHHREEDPWRVGHSHADRGLMGTPSAAPDMHGTTVTTHGESSSGRGVSIGPGPDWFVPLELIDSIVQHRQAQRASERALLDAAASAVLPALTGGSVCRGGSTLSEDGDNSDDGAWDEDNLSL